MYLIFSATIMQPWKIYYNYNTQCGFWKARWQNYWNCQW